MAKSWAVCCASNIGLRSKFSLSSLALSPSPLVCWHGLCVYVSNTHSGIICASCHIAMLSLILSSLHLSLVEAKAGRAPWSGVFFHLTSGFLFYFTLLFCLVIKFFVLFPLSSCFWVWKILCVLGMPSVSALYYKTSCIFTQLGQYCAKNSLMPSPRGTRKLFSTLQSISRFPDGFLTCCAKLSVSLIRFTVSLCACRVVVWRRILVYLIFTLEGTE